MVTIDKFPKASKITIYSLGVFLGLLHIFFGLVALTPVINQDYHRDIKISFNTFTKTLPYVHEFIAPATLSLVLRYSIAAFQLLFGALILENGHFGKLSQLGNYGLIFVNLKLMFLQMSIKAPLERMAPTIVFVVLLTTRLVMLEQGLRKIPAPGLKGKSSKPKTSTPKKNKNE